MRSTPHTKKATVGDLFKALANAARASARLLWVAMFDQTARRFMLRTGAHWVVFAWSGAIAFAAGGSSWLLDIGEPWLAPSGIAWGLFVAVILFARRST